MASGICVIATSDPICGRPQRKRTLKDRLFYVPKLLRSMFALRQTSVAKLEYIPCGEEENVVSPKESTSTECRQLQSLPDEMFVEVFKYLDRPALLNMRRVCHRYNGVVLRNLRNSLPAVKVSRLTITYVEDTYKFVWCKYTAGENACHELLVPSADLSHPNPALSFCFAQLDIQRLIIESMPKNVFNDKFVRFLCDQFQNCRDFKPVQLSVKNVDLSKLSPDSLKQLLIRCSKKLEILEFFGIGNVASDLITDEHLLLLEHNRVRRLSIQFNESHEETRFNSLQVGDESLQTFARAGIFPTFAMGHCSVSAAAVCEYVKEWLQMVDEEDFMKSHSLTLSDCPNVSSESLEEECERQGLALIKRVDDSVDKFPSDSSIAANGTLINYTIRLNKPQQGFVINLFTTHHHHHHNHSS